MSHPNARLTVHGRALLCRRIDAGWTLSNAAAAAGVSRQTASKWLSRYRQGGEDVLRDRTSRPRRMPTRTSHARVKRIVLARVRFREGPHRLSWYLRIARSTIYAVLRRVGLSRIRDLDPPAAPPVRYEWPKPGDMVHLDVKKLGRIPEGGGWRIHGKPGNRRKGGGWQYVHTAVDDHSRLAYAQVLDSEGAQATVGFTRRALDFFEMAGFSVRRILTDNGNGYRSHRFRDLCEERGVSHWRTRAYRPQTNGKAEAFIKILSARWAYGRPYASNEERTDSLAAFLDHYNLRRPHGGIGGLRPIERV